MMTASELERRKQMLFEKLENGWGSDAQWLDQYLVVMEALLSAETGLRHINEGEIQ